MSLVEVVVATALFAMASLAAAHLLVWATRVVRAAGAETVALAAAQAKIEELQALTWRFDEHGNRASDLQTDLSTTPPSPGGPGLASSPANVLAENVGGYVDFLDRDGRSVGSGIDPPPSATFVRRWAVRPMAAAREDLLLLEVLVMPLANRPQGAPGVARPPGQASLTTARVRLRGQ